MGESTQREKEKGRKGRERNANLTNAERALEENDLDPERNETDHEFPEEHWDVNFTASGDDHSSDLDWGEIGNFGTDSGAGKFLQNNEGAHGY